MRPLSNFAARDVETLLHPTTNLLAHRLTVAVSSNLSACPSEQPAPRVQESR